jgi:hypothetical protein
MNGPLAHPPRPQAPLETLPFERIAAPDGTSWLEFHREARGYRLRFPGHADFGLSADGQEIEVWPAPGASEATVRHLYLNQVRPLALSRQGRLVLHASAVDLEGQGIAFAGPSGRGKSTLAAAFARRGAGFLCDDGLRLDLEADGIRIEPSDASLRLWEDSREALALEEAALAPPLDYTPKARLLAGAGLPHCAEPRPLRALFLLGEDTPHVRITPLAPADALRELLRLLTVLDLEARDVLAAHFQALTRIAGAGLVFGLEHPRRYAALAEVRGAVAAHVQRCLGGG